MHKCIKLMNILNKFKKSKERIAFLLKIWYNQQDKKQQKGKKR